MAEFNNLIDQLTVLQRQDLTSTEKFVAIVILSFRNSQNGRCNPPIVSKTKGKETVCTRTGFSDVCVQKAIKGLEQKGVFSVSRELGQTSFFEFTGTNEVSKGTNEVSTGTNDITPNEVSKGTNEVSTGTNEVSTGTNDTPPNEVSTGTNEVSKGYEPRLGGVLTTLVHNKEITKKEQRNNKEDGGAPSPSLSQKPVKEKSQGTSFTLETLPDDWKDTAEKLAPDLDPEKLFEEFSDYWKAVPGERGRKKDWLATFRNHIRNLPDWKRKNFRKTNSCREPETREPDFSKIDYGESGLLSDFKF